MSLARCLGTQPPAQLRSLAKQLGIAEPANGKAEQLLDAVSAHLKSPDYLARILDELDESERAALKVITFAGGGSGIVMEQCHQRINQVTGRRRRNGAQVVAGLMGRGMVYVGRAKYRQYYFIPNDLQAPLAALFGQELLSRVIMPAGIEVQVEGNDSYAVLRWICQFLAFTRKEEVELTQAGAIYRRTQRQLLSMMGREADLDEPPTGNGADHPYAGLHPDPLDFVFDYCRSRELVDVRENFLIASTRAAEWVRSTVWTRREDLLGFWRESRVSWDVDVQAVLSVLTSLPDDAWVDMKALFREVEPMASDLFRGSLRRRLENKVVRYLILQGLLAVGESSAGTVCRLTKLGYALLHNQTIDDDIEPEANFFVQPDFEMLVPAHIDTAVLWRIEEIADLEKPDWMMVYRISRGSIYRALRLGKRADDILAVLEKHSAVELPQNVVFSVRDWAAAFGRIRFAEAFTMQVDSPALADELVASRTIGKYVLGKLSPTVLIIERKHHADLVAALEAEGYMPSPGILELGRGDSWIGIEFTPGGLVESPVDAIK